MSGSIAAYVQALPVTLADSQSQKGKFGDMLLGASFVLSHSSKVALSVAKRIGGHDVIAIGHSSVLHEALARGATSAISVPLFDNPLAQARSFPPDQRFSTIVIPENLDGWFSGAALAGAIAVYRELNFSVLEDSHFTENCVILVRDNSRPDAIDIRRINGATNVEIKDEEPAIGELEVSKSSQDAKRREEISGDEKSVSNAIARRIRRSIIKLS